MLMLSENEIDGMLGNVGNAGSPGSETSGKDIDASNDGIGIDIEKLMLGMDGNVGNAGSPGRLIDGKPQLIR